jgi:hypothetical protein
MNTICKIGKEGEYFPIKVQSTRRQLEHEIGDVKNGRRRTKELAEGGPPLSSILFWHF